MKKTYQKPEVFVTEMMNRLGIMVGSLEETKTVGRRVGDEISDLTGDADASLGGGKVIPNTIEGVSTVENPFGTHGQGNGGDGTRAKSWAWD